MKKFCGNCGSPLEDDVKICGNCGALVENIDRSTFVQDSIEDKRKKKVRKMVIAVLIFVASVVAVTVGVPRYRIYKEACQYYEAGKRAFYGKDGVSLDLQSAYTNFDKAAELGNKDANFYLGTLYYWKNYPEHDLEKAKEFYEKAGNNPYAKVSLGFICFSGQGIDQDLSYARKLWEDSIGQNCVEGYIGLGTAAIGEEDYVTALECYEKALDGTEQIYITYAMKQIAFLYRNGYGVEQNCETAMEWYIKAANMNDTGAMCSIGYMYRKGEGVKQDYEEAIAWYAKAAALNDSNAMNSLGIMYNFGQGVEHDDKKALEWYEKAANLGHIAAMSNMAQVYCEGSLELRDYIKGIEWYQKAANLGSAYAMIRIGDLYYEGLGLGEEKDYTVALEWYEKAIAVGDSSAEEKAETIRNILNMENSGEDPDLSFYIGTDIYKFADTYRGMEIDSSSEGAITCSDGNVIASSSNSDTSTISSIIIQGESQYSVKGIQCGMDFDVATQIAKEVSTHVSEGSNGYKEYYLEGTIRFILCQDENGMVEKIKIWDHYL